MSRSGCFLLLMLLCLQLSAQHRDTVFVTETKVVYDTIVQRDTLFLHDTLHLKDIRPQENPTPDAAATDVDVRTSESEFPKRESARKKHWKYREKGWKQSDLFEGFQLGLLMDVGVLTPAKLRYANPDYETFIGSEKYAPLKASPGVGGHVGLEFSYHFAQYFGLSAGLTYGTTRSLRVHAESKTPGYQLFDYKHYCLYFMGLSMPLKFEFHMPVARKLWFTASAGVRLRMPWRTFIAGYDEDIDYLDFQRAQLLPDTLNYLNLTMIPKSVDPNHFNIDILADAGLYLQLSPDWLFRWTVGANIAFRDFASGELSIRFDPSNDFLPPAAFSAYEYAWFRLRSHLFYTQVSFVHTFQHQRVRAEAFPHWTTDQQLRRHEFKLEFCDPTGVMLFDRYFVAVYPEQLSPGNSWRSDGFRSTPVFSFAYHYRAAKWFWLGVSMSYAHYRDSQTYQYPNSSETGTYNRNFHTLAIMPEVRFSYLNRPHVTLYSALSVGLAQFFGDQSIDNLTYPENPQPWCSNLDEPHFPTEFSTLHITLLGAKASWRHWFASFELGAGYKGLGAVGVGYEF